MKKWKRIVNRALAKHRSYGHVLFEEEMNALDKMRDSEFRSLEPLKELMNLMIKMI